MFSLERIGRLGQIKGMAYEPTPSDVVMKGQPPNCGDPDRCRDFDMDYFNSDFADLWGPSGRSDLASIRAQNVNLMRLYNWTGNESAGRPLRSHLPYLEHCRTLGLGTMVPFSNHNANLSPVRAQHSAHSIVGELTSEGALHPAVKMWQVTNEFELAGIRPQDVARLVECIVRAEAAAGITDDRNKIPFVVSISTAPAFGVAGQSMGQVEALRHAFHGGGTLADGTVVPGNAFLEQRRVWQERFVIGVQSFQYLGEIEGFVEAMWRKYQGEVPIVLSEHGYNAVDAAATGPPLPGNKGTHDVANQGRIVARQIADANAIYRRHSIFRGMCFFQWLDTSYKCGQPGADNNKCKEANFGEVQWTDFGAAPPQPARTGRTGKGQPYPVDDAIRKTEVYETVTKGFGAG